jgi:hypothetical protein
MNLYRYCIACLLIFMIAVTIYAVCYPTYLTVTLWDSGCSPDLTILKKERNGISWHPDGFLSTVDTTGYGGCNSQGDKCYPEFRTPIVTDHWEQTVQDRYIGWYAPNGCGDLSSRTYTSYHTLLYAHSRILFEWRRLFQAGGPIKCRSWRRL